MSRTRMVVATVLVAWVLGACSDDDPKPDIGDPTPSASTSTATSPSTALTTSTTAPMSGPRQAVDEWLTAWTHAMQTGETESVARLSTDACDSCQRLIDKVEEVYGKGGHFETDGWSATRISEAPNSVEVTPSYVMQVVQADRTLFGADGKPVDTEPSMTQPMRMTFQRADDQWLVTRLEILQ